MSPFFFGFQKKVKKRVIVNMVSRKAKKISVIIVSHNRKKDVLECLESVRKLDYLCYEIIVVDNGSTDGSFEALSKEGNCIKLIETGANLGTAAAINVGIKNSSGEFFLLLADDVVVHGNALKELVNVMESDDRIGVAGSLIYFYDKPSEIWFYPREFVYKKEKNIFIDVPEAVGCALMTKKSVIDKIGFFDENYFTYHEEQDFCLRARKQGFRVVCALKSYVWHKVPFQDPYREFSLFRAYYFNRNNFLFAKKHFPTIRGRLDSLFKQFIFYPTGKYEAKKSLLSHFPWLAFLKAALNARVDVLASSLHGIVDGIVWFLRTRKEDKI